MKLLGLTRGEHMVGLYREALRAPSVLSSGEPEGQRDGQAVRVAGLVVVRQRPLTAKGHVFITPEDVEVLINLIMRLDVYHQYQSVLRGAPLLLVEGQLQWERHALGVLVHRATTLE